MVHGAAARRAAADPARRRAVARTSTGRPGAVELLDRGRADWPRDRPPAPGRRVLVRHQRHQRARDPRGGARPTRRADAEPAATGAPCPWLLSGRERRRAARPGRAGCAATLRGRPGRSTRRRRPLAGHHARRASSTAPWSSAADRDELLAGAGRARRRRAGAGRSSSGAGRRGRTGVPVHRPGQPAARHGPRAVRGASRCSPSALDEVCAELDPHLDRPLRDVMFGDDADAAGPDRATPSPRCSRSRWRCSGCWSRGACAPDFAGRPLDRRARRRARGRACCRWPTRARWSPRAAG